MSLAMSAAPFDDENYTLNNEKQKLKPTGHNKTQKRRQHTSNSVDTAKMSNLLQTLHNSTDDDSNNGNEMGDFNPPAAPESSGVEKTTDVKESPVSKYLREGPENQTGGYVNQATEYQDERLEMNNYLDNYGSKASNEDYYKQFIPNYPRRTPPNADSINKPYYDSYQTIQTPQGPDNTVLMEKLNYMIHLLEEQQDERLGSVTEEVILYSFLGIFIIFLADSFTRIGKYKR